MLKRSRGYRRRIGVPKGMLRHLTLKLIEKRPMSGSEIMEKIEEFTDWRPSPGSIYPLLAHLQEDGVIELHVDEDPNLKRFSLTESGLQMMEEYSQVNGQLRNRHKSIHKILHREMPEDLYESFSTLLDAVEKTYERLAADPGASERFKEIMGEASSKLLEIGA
jgi:DNA-binding PadR family transcriptional regulator